MKCLLCGYQFEENEGSTTCVGCPLSKGCNMVCCPNCGYEIPLNSKLIELFKKRGTVKNESK